MRFRPIGFIPALMAMAIAIVSLHGSSQAQLSVTLSASPSPTPVPTTMTAPSDPFNLEATVSGYSSPTTIDKVVFYRNDVPYEVDTVSPYKLAQADLGQNNYTYRARAYASNGEVADSSDFKLTVNTPKAIRIDVPPNTDDLGPAIESAISTLGSGGGTIFFRCNITANQTAKFVIRSTVDVPSNITFQGESAMDAGRCQLWWANSGTGETSCGSGGTPNSTFTPMFRVLSTASRVRFKDLHLRSMTNGLQCYPRQDMDEIAVEKTAAIELEGAANDIIIENVSIANFTHGIRAASTGEGGVRNVRIRGVRALFNHRQLFVDADLAYDWDVQNLNITGMDQIQGGVEIKKAGRPSTFNLSTSMKFLQLNCNGNPEREGFCLKVRKHGGIYIKQMHHEGIGRGLLVEDISGDSSPNNVNNDPIILEASVGSGQFEDASMQLYMVGNSIFASPLVWPDTHDDTTMQFNGDGRDADVYDCGDVHWDWTDTKNPLAPNDPYGLVLQWEDLRMAGTHSERYRGSFFLDNYGYAYVKEHTPCPANIKDYGGEHFDTSVLPTEVKYNDSGTMKPAYSRILDTTTCPGFCTADDVSDWFDTNLAVNGTIYVDGDFQVERTINVPKGKQIFGSPGSSLTLATSGIELFKIDILLDDPSGRVSAIVIRNLELIRGSNVSGATTGIKMIGTTSGTAGTSSDMHFSGLKIEGFNKGLTAAPYVYPTPTPTVTPTPTPPGHPMIDGLSWKDLNFVNNEAAVEITSANLSNWNVMDLNVTSNTGTAVGWSQRTGGHISLQNVNCVGSGTAMSDCVKLEFAGTYLTGLKTTNVTNGLTVGLSPEMWGGTKYHSRQVSNLVLRNNDFRNSDLDILGKSFVTSMNNKYADINILSTYDGIKSRVTRCGDDYGSGPGFGDLNDLDLNRYVGVNVPTEVGCGPNPYQWEEAVMFFEDSPYSTITGVPFAGNFFGDPTDDYVVFKWYGSTGYFYIQERGGTESDLVDYGTTGDIPLVGDIMPSSTNAQIIQFRPGSTNAVFYWKDPVSLSTAQANWGLPTDRPFVGNFLDETGSADKDEIAIYRPSDGYIWILNPYSAQTIAFPTGISGSAAANHVIQVADFLGTGGGRQQIALYDKTDGSWALYDPLNLATLPLGTDSGVSNYTSSDIPVAAQYWSDDCAQIAVWRPSTQKFIVQEPSFSPCGSRGEEELVWGGNNFGSTVSSEWDIPLTMSHSHGIRKPTTYRPVQGLYEYGIAKGTWWVHDPVPEP